MNALIVFLAALNVLIWGHNAVMIAGIIGSIISGGIVMAEPKRMMEPS